MWLVTAGLPVSDPDNTIERWLADVGYKADDILPSWLGLWWAHALVVLSALFWLQRQGRMVGQT